MNSMEKFRGPLRLKRPPVICWEKDAEDRLKSDLEDSENDQLQALMREASLGSDSLDTDNLRIMAATWNLHGKCPTTSDLDQLFH